MLDSNIVSYFRIISKGERLMKLMTVSDVSRTFNVSTRMLRYYEKEGLISSRRMEGYAYRIYDEEAVTRLQLILILRKLRVSLKDISTILGDKEGLATLNVLRKNIEELSEESGALNAIRNILQSFIEKINESLLHKEHFNLLEGNELIDLPDTLCLSKPKFKEVHSMNEINEVSKPLEKKIDVRMVLLPPCSVASYHYIGENPEEVVGAVMDKFVSENKLYELKPDSRMFGFNHPSPSEQLEHYGYEVWVTIPDNMEVSAPLVKKTFEGGLYAAHTIDFPNFQEWQLLFDWGMNNDRYQINPSPLGDEIMNGCLEEHLNWVYSSHMCWPENGIDGKLDLLLPVKAK